MTKPFLYLMLLVGGALAAGAGVLTYGEWQHAQQLAEAVAPSEPQGRDVAAPQAPAEQEREPAKDPPPAVPEESLAMPQPDEPPARQAPQAPAAPEGEVAARPDAPQSRAADEAPEASSAADAPVAPDGPAATESPSAPAQPQERAVAAAPSEPAAPDSPAAKESPSAPAQPQERAVAAAPSGPAAPDSPEPAAPPSSVDETDAVAAVPQERAAEPGEAAAPDAIESAIAPSESAEAETTAPEPTQPTAAAPEPATGEATEQVPQAGAPSPAPQPFDSAALQPGATPSEAGEPAAPAPSAAAPEADEPANAAPAEPGEPDQPAEAATGGPAFDIVRVEPTGEAVIAGRAPGRSKIEVLSNGEVVAETSADEGGNWVALPQLPLKPGSHDLSLRALDEDGEATESEERVAIAVPEEPGEEVVAVLDRPGEPSDILAGPEREPSQGASEPPQKLEPMATASEPAETGQALLSVDAVEAEGRTMFVAGAGDPGALVRVYVDGELVGQAEAGAEGRWLVEASRELEEEGKVTVRADQLKAGTAQVEARAEVPFLRRLDMASLVPVAQAGAGAGDSAEGGDLPQPGAVIIRRGDNLWTISRRTYGRGVRYTTIYKANDDQIRDPHWIYPGQVFVIPTRDRAWDED